MKISYLSGSVIPSKTANSIHVMKMCQALAGEGHSITLYARRGEIQDDPYQFYGVNNSFKICYIPHPNVRSMGQVYGFICALLSKTNKTDLVIGRHIKACFFSVLFNIPTVFETHGPIKNSSGIKSWILKKLISNQFFKKLVVITQSLAMYYEEKYPILTGNIITVPDGSDPINLDRKKMGIGKSDKLNVGYVGHLYKGKGMEVISQLITRCSSFAYFHIVGGKEKDIEKWSNELEVFNNVTFYGHVPHSEIPRYLLSFDALLLPNQLSVYSNAGNEIGDWTSPLKLFEYMAARKPIIASNIPVLKEILEHDKNAVLCDPEKITEWENALLRIKKDQSYAKKIAQEAHFQFKKKYTWQARAKNILSSID